MPGKLEQPTARHLEASHAIKSLTATAAGQSFRKKPILQLGSWSEGYQLAAAQASCTSHSLVAVLAPCTSAARSPAKQPDQHVSKHLVSG